jgi:hypothetical protein
MFSCVCYHNLSTKVAHKLAPRSIRCIFLIYSADHKGYRCLDLTNNNIVVSRYVIFYEAYCPFSSSPRLTNNLDIFLHGDSSGATSMPAPLPAPHVPSGFPPLVIAGGQNARPGDQTVPRTEADGQTVGLGGHTTPRTEVDGLTGSPSSQTAPCIEAGGPTATPGGPTSRPCAAPSPTSVAPCDSHDFGCAPCGALDSTYATCDSDIPALPTALLTSSLGCAAATSTASTLAVDEGHTGGTSGQPSFDDHAGEAGLPADKLTMLATSTSTLSLVPSSVRVTLVNPNWCRAMKEKFAALITNNT